MRSVKQKKIELIHRINTVLLIHYKGPITSEDFDTLYDLDIDQLMDVELRLEKDLKGYPPLIHK